MTSLLTIQQPFRCTRCSTILEQVRRCHWRTGQWRCMYSAAWRSSCSEKRRPSTTGVGGWHLTWSWAIFRVWIRTYEKVLSHLRYLNLLVTLVNWKKDFNKNVFICIWETYQHYNSDMKSGPYHKRKSCAGWTLRCQLKRRLFDMRHRLRYQKGLLVLGSPLLQPRCPHPLGNKKNMLVSD